MSFVWIQNISVGSRLDAADLNEMRINIQTLRTALGLGAYGYAASITVGKRNNSIDWSQTRVALDQAKDENYCHTDCGSDMESDQAHMGIDHADNGSDVGATVSSNQAHNVDCADDGTNNSGQQSSNQGHMGIDHGHMGIDHADNGADVGATVSSNQAHQIDDGGDYKEDCYDCPLDHTSHAVSVSCPIDYGANFGNGG